MDFDPADVVAALAPHLGSERAAKLDAVAGARLGGVIAVLEDLRDPHNMSAALRSCEAMGVLGVHVIAVRHRYRTATRITQGCEKWLTIERHAETRACADLLHSRGVQILAAVPGASRRLGEIDAGQKIALCFGNEHLGLSPELRRLSDGDFTIPMHGCSQSLNVSVSVAVALHAVTEARRRALGRAGDLDEAALLALRARYYARDLRGAEAIVARFCAARKHG